MVGNDDVDLGHEADGFGEGNDDLVVVGDVVVGEGAAFAVLEPFLTDLIPSNVEGRDRLGHALKSGALGFVNPDRLVGIGANWQHSFR